MPEDAQPLVLLGPGAVEILESRVDAEVLVRPCEVLNQPAGAFEIGDEVLKKVQQRPRVAGATQRALHRNLAPGARSVDDIPIAKNLPRRVRRADLRLAAI